jgi:hypothetical protein
MIREYVSVLPPGGKGTMKRIGREGYDCAWARVVARVAHAIAPRTSKGPGFFTALSLGAA